MESARLRAFLAFSLLSRRSAEGLVRSVTAGSPLTASPLAGEEDSEAPTLAVRSLASGRAPVEANSPTLDSSLETDGERSSIRADGNEKSSYGSSRRALFSATLLSWLGAGLQQSFATRAGSLPRTAEASRGSP